MRGCFVLVLALLAAQAPARADSAGDDAPAGEVGPDSELGPVITIEAITVSGNTSTQEKIIRRALPIAPGDVLKASDPRLRDARFKLLAQGFFRDVTIAMRKGSARGQVIIDIKVVERGTLVLNRIWFGTSNLSNDWIGADAGDRNLLGLGISIGAGIIYAGPGHFDQARGRQPKSPQTAAELRIGASAIRGSRWGLNASITDAHGNDYNGVEFDGDASVYKWTFEYKRLTSRFGVSYDITPLTRLSGQLRIERLDFEHLNERDDSSRSYVNTAAVAFDHDTRSDPILPHTGSEMSFVFEGGSRAFPLSGDYTFATLFVHGEHWFPLRGGHTSLGIKASVGHVYGEAPRFDYIYINDIDPMLAPRALGLLLSDAQPIEFLRSGRLSSASPAFGTTGGLGTVELATELFRGPGRRRVYGGDIFVAAGMWALDRPYYGTSADLYFDIGLRLDTEVGIFELTIGNGLGRIR